MINEKDALRLYVRKAIRLYKENKQQQQLHEEQKFRQLISKKILMCEVALYMNECMYGGMRK